jgi:hypothetical protein
MARPNVVTSIATIFSVATLSCESLLGDVDVFTSPRIAVPASGGAGPMEPQRMDAPSTAGAAPAGVSPVDVLRPAPSGEASGEDAGSLDMEPDASPAPLVPRAIVADGPAAELPRLGIDGGEPRLGVCPGGVVIGVRTTANPSEEVFGQRLTFIEPICGKALHQPRGAAGDSSGTISVTRDDSMVAWAETDGFLGVPSLEVPDPRLLWVLQPDTLCPEATPVLVGLSGEYDPVAPDVGDTAAIRSLVIECAPLMLAANGIDVGASQAGHVLISNADSFAAPGVATYRSACEGGAVTTQIQVHAGFWLDGFVLGCSSLRVE